MSRKRVLIEWAAMLGLIVAIGLVVRADLRARSPRDVRLVSRALRMSGDWAELDRARARQGLPPVPPDLRADVQAMQDADAAAAEPR